MVNLTERESAKIELLSSGYLLRRRRKNQTLLAVPNERMTVPGRMDELYFLFDSMSLNAKPIDSGVKGCHVFILTRKEDQ